MKTLNIDNLHITIDKEGARAYSKVSYPLRYGRFAEISTPEHVFQFNLNGELKFVNGRGKSWPDPSEWLKRTMTDDWVYYSTGGYDGIYDCFGEYYLPCLSYQSNNINSWDPFQESAVISAIKAWERLHKKLTGLDPGHLPKRVKEFLDLVILNSPVELHKRSGKIHEILGDKIKVLPPDTRHVDYDVIPIIIADGCLHKCGFCRVKSNFNFKERSKENIKIQIKELRDFFGSDISNYNSIFLGQHDALYSSIDLIKCVALNAFDTFKINNSNLGCPNLFMFGSVDSIIKSPYSVCELINKLPFMTYINIGLESSDQHTLDKLRKGITTEAVEIAFTKIVDINKRYERIEITSNFVLGADLPDGHIKSFLRLIGKNFDHPFHKGTIYFSPLINTVDTGW
ncbi:MAG TPA: radical SAM protein, partial [Dissulfurispiraceae bacterium]|nr:radical SAM protein [Dissulfurispiraceae bacterium]